MLANDAIPVFPYDPREIDLSRWLGPTEQLIMRVLWSAERPLSLTRVRGYLRLHHGHDRTPQTVQTILNRLMEKGIVRRDGTRVRYTFAALCSQEAFEEAQEQAILESLGVAV